MPHVAKSLLSPLSLVLATLFLAACSAQTAPGDGEGGGHTLGPLIQAQAPTYPLDTCIVSDEPLDDSAVDHVLDGRLVRLCCEGCLEGIEEDKAELLAKLDAAVVSAQLADYPLTTCVISDEELGSMGDPVEVVHGTRLVRLCCESCRKSFEKDPDTYLAVIDAAKSK